VTTQLPPSPINGLEIYSENSQTGQVFYAATVQKVLALSQYNPNQYSLAGLPGFWEIDGKTQASLPNGALQLGAWYKVALSTKPKPPGPRTNPGSLYQDIKKAVLATDTEIPEQQPTQAANSPETGSQRHQDRPVGDFNTGMAFNQACTLVAALITSDHPQARDWLDYDYIIEEVQALRERLYHDVLMQPIGAPDEEPGADYEITGTNDVTTVEEPEMPPLPDEEPQDSLPF